MSPLRCPGQDPRNWKGESSEEVLCPYCGHNIEFFRDEPARPCRGCGKEVRNPHLNLGCAKWCKYAKQCLGLIDDVTNHTGSLCERIMERMKKYFGDDEKRIAHARAVLHHSEQILTTEPKASGLVVRAAAILHDIGIHQAEQKHGSSAGKYQELEGPPIARDILEDLKAPEEDIDHICKIVGSHHSANDIDTIEFRIVRDADLLVNIQDENDTIDQAKMSDLIENVLKTLRGKQIAKKLLMERKEK